MTVTLEAAKRLVKPEEDVYSTPDPEHGERSYILKFMDAGKVRAAIGQLVRQAERTLGKADALATCAADNFPGEDFSRIIPCFSVGLPVKDPEHRLCIRDLPEATAPERIIPRASIPEPPPAQWQREDSYTWALHDFRVMFLFSLRAWTVFQCEDPGWLGPVGTFETAEEAMRAVDNDDLHHDSDL